VHRDGDEVTGARLRDVRTGEETDVEARVTVNAAGAWAGHIAELAGIEGVRILPGRGIMIAMNHRLVNTVINRCQMPTDGDILVPIRTVSVIGHHRRAHRRRRRPHGHRERGRPHARRRREARAGLRKARAMRVWTGRGPLFEDAKAADTDTRDVTARARAARPRRPRRRRALRDHHGRQAHDLPAHGGGDHRRRSAATSVRCARARPPPSRCRAPESGEFYKIGERLARKETQLADEQLICECEMVPRSRLEEAMRRRQTHNLDDIRRTLRLGMGPVPGRVLHLPRRRDPARPGRA
jgi:glycerol-3-phosphate dehydrogenase